MTSLLEKSANTLIVGSIIQGRYQVLNKIKGGALSRTYLIQDLGHPNQPKCVLKHYPYNKELPRLYKTNMRLFLKEAKHLQVLSIHPQIPRLIDYFGITDQGWFLVQELIEGKPLNTTLPLSEYSDKCWQVNEVWNLIHDVSGILQFIHSQKIIHCDLKPNNIIRRDSDKRMIVIDFGSAQYMPGYQGNDQPQGVLSLRTKITVSPSGYLAPEQLNGTPHAASDIYALGVIAIQAWTGLDPARMKKDAHTGEVVWDQYLKINGEAEQIRQLAAVINRMVRPEIQERYASVKELIDDLEKIQHHELTTTPPAPHKSSLPSVPLSPSKPSARPRPAAPLTPLEEDPWSAQEILFKKSTVQPPELTEDIAKQTIVQEDFLPDESFKQTMHQEDMSLFDLSEMSTTGLHSENLLIGLDPDLHSMETFEEDLHSEDLPVGLKKKRSKSLLDNVPLVAGFSISVVVINAVLISLGLQYLISRMVEPEANSLEQAQQAYAQGNFESAIALAKAVPQKSPAYEESQAAIQKWQGEWSTLSKGFDQLKLAFDKQDWQEVVKLSKTVNQHPFWQSKAAEMVKQAQFQIDVAAYKVLQESFDVAAKHDFATAMNNLKKAVPNSKFAPVIEAKLAEYKEKQAVRAKYDLQQAINHAQIREFSAAIADLKKIPADTAPGKIAKVKIVEYSQKQIIKDQVERHRKNRASAVTTSPVLAQLNPGLEWRGIHLTQSV